jgi:hypothetical protein
MDPIKQGNVSGNLIGKHIVVAQQSSHPHSLLVSDPVPLLV